MLTAEGCKARRKRLWEKLADKPDWVIISDPQHQMYFANYFQSPFVFRTTNAAAVLILGRDGSAILVADSMLQVFADKAVADELVCPPWYNGKTTAPHREALLIKNALDWLAKHTGDHIGYEPSTVPTGILEGLRAARPSLKLTSVDAAIHEMKRRKDPDELAVLRRSMAAGDAGHAAGMREIKPGMTELQAYLTVQNACIEALGEQAIVYGDFVSGPRCEKVGGPPSDRVIQQNELVLLDFSVVVGGYRGDFANTFACQGRATDEQRRLYEACMQAIGVGESMLKPGTLCRDIDRAIRESFNSKHLGQNFTTHSGHGVGLGHPDPPYIVPESSDTLIAGDVVTLEPGQYVQGVGGMRYERNYLITDSGFELLSKLQLTIDPGTA